MIVSGGIGTSIVPLRLGVPPEIVRVELQAPKINGGSDSSRAP
jgi:predicted MPP superfamily phosphohydrolase